ncbi:hypothetical protein CI238_08354 [Colletotrichum incanum]|uniref:Uncharacterized protein n=1 Tax=Colletotrichum incanum TaxID=1573173 RepID=A0A167AHU5_COLIC|nr:hypothetical protein CI238_08354 [Colletotrichum incanum]
MPATETIPREDTVKLTNPKPTKWVRLQPPKSCLAYPQTRQPASHTVFTLIRTTASRIAYLHLTKLTRSP